MLLKELFQMNEDDTEVASKKKKKKEPKDKSADKFTTYVGGNTILQQTSSGELSGTKKISKDLRQ